ncbi:MAG: YdjY domain-containing protein [Planctomycetota bacterium]
MTVCRLPLLVLMIGLSIGISGCNTSDESGSGATSETSDSSKQPAEEGGSATSVATDSEGAGAEAVSGDAGTTEMPESEGLRELPSASGSETEDPESVASAWEDIDFDLPKKKAIAAFLDPPKAKSLSKSGRLWVDRTTNRVYVDGYVTLRQGPLEMFACPVGTKEHESIVAAIAESSEVHAALLAIEATPGAPVRYRPEFSPPTGEVIRVWVCWYDEEGQFQTVDGRSWVREIESKKELSAEWVFAGSGFWEDPEDKREYYRADSGDMICVSNFASAMLDVSVESSAEGDLLLYEPFSDRIPPRETPVRLVLAPVAQSDDGSTTEPDAPVESDVPRALSNETSG